MKNNSIVKIKLLELLCTMEVPEGRKNLIEENLLWLKRNLGIKNNQHKDFHEAMFMVKFLLDER